MHYNTISKLIWLKENKPQIFKNMSGFLFLPSLIIHRLTGELVTDTSMAGTSELTDNKKRNFSSAILQSIGLPERFFSNLLEPGRVAGRILQSVSEETGIPEGTPVVATGHDTQFAVYGSRADSNQPVLSSGTWEILMVRVQRLVNTEEMMALGVSTELDSIPGFFNTGLQWIASGAVEWMKRTLFSGQSDHRIYDAMAREAEAVRPGSGGVFIHPAFVSGIGPSAPFKTKGSILGLTMDAPRGAVYRALLEALACQTRQSIEILERAAGFKAVNVICVGGGSRNKLWNQLRADLLGVPVTVLDQKETTALGAAIFAFVGAGIYKDPEEARKAFIYNEETVKPSSGRNIYEPVYERFKGLAKNLSDVYQ
jgi:L-fuculokinase